MANNPVQILLAEDDDGHARLVERNLRRVGLLNQITRVRDGQEALDFIFCQGPFVERTAEGSLLIVLDIKMPRVDGIAVLQRIKADPQKAKLPVIMLTTTDDPREVARCYELGCNVYICKPVEYQSFVEAINRLGLFLQVVTVLSEEQL